MGGKKNKVKNISITDKTSNDRSNRPKNIAQMHIPLQKGDCVSVILYKNINCYMMMALNEENHPIRCWCSAVAIFPFKSRYLKVDNFESVLQRLNPSTLHTNSGELVPTFMKLPHVKIVPITKPLDQYLNDLKNQYMKADKIDNTLTLNKKQITYKEAKELVESKLSYKEYKLLFCSD